MRVGLVVSLADVVLAASTTPDGAVLELLGTDGFASMPAVAGLDESEQWVVGEAATALPAERTVRALRWWDVDGSAQVSEHELTGVAYVVLFVAAVRARVRPENEKVTDLTVLVPGTFAPTLQDELSAALGDVEVCCWPTAAAAAHCALDELPVLTGGTFVVIDWRGGQPDVAVVQRYTEGFTLIAAGCRTFAEPDEVASLLPQLAASLVPDAPWLLAGAADVLGTMSDVVHSAVASARTMTVDIEDVVVAAAQPAIRNRLFAVQDRRTVAALDEPTEPPPVAILLPEQQPPVDPPTPVARPRRSRRLVLAVAASAVVLAAALVVAISVSSGPSKPAATGGSNRPTPPAESSSDVLASSRDVVASSAAPITPDGIPIITGTAVASARAPDSVLSQRAVADFLAALNAHDPSSARTSICAVAQPTFDRSAAEPSGLLAFAWDSPKLVSSEPAGMGLTLVYRVTLGRDGAAHPATVRFLIVGEHGPKICGISF